KENTEEDVERVINTARSVSIPADREIIHVIPQEFVVDDQDGIHNPVGMSGVRLEAEVHIVTGAVSAAQNIIKSVNRAGYEVADIILEPMASAEAVLNDDEKELGAAVIDIGGGTTDLVIIVENAIWHTAVIPIGGNHVTSDISFGIRTPNQSAELIKKQFGSALCDAVDENDYIEVPLVGGRPPKKLARKMLSKIIEPRIEEIFTLAAQEIKKNNYYERLAAGTILTGGSALLENICDTAERILEHPVRVGQPKGITGLSESVNSPIYSTAVGLALLGIRGEGSGREEKRDNAISGIRERMSRWFKEFF
ncbi:MAG TPA: cell division protein FtsA, partial [Spirochaetia bacterium]|nr:cell division protein FtsA [Spirochaetia bacterium]